MFSSPSSFKSTSASVLDLFYMLSIISGFSMIWWWNFAEFSLTEHFSVGRIPNFRFLQNKTLSRCQGLWRSVWGGGVHLLLISWQGQGLIINSHRRRGCFDAGSRWFTGKTSRYRAYRPPRCHLLLQPSWEAASSLLGKSVRHNLPVYRSSLSENQSL